MSYRGALDINLEVRAQERRFQLLRLEAAAEAPRRAQAGELRTRLAQGLRSLAVRLDPAAHLTGQVEAA